MKSTFQGNDTTVKSRILYGIIAISLGMRRRRYAGAILIIALLVGLLALVSGLIWAWQKPTPELEYLGAQMTSINGKYCFKRTFGVSNNCDSVIMLKLGAIEVNSQQGWLVYTNDIRISCTLPPHRVEQFSIYSPRIDGTWRFRVSTLNERTGLGAYLSYSKMCWGYLRSRHKFGSAAGPWPRRPSATIKIFDTSAELVSRDITE